MARKRILVIGYGNPGRGDDGLGPALAARLEALDIPLLTVESDYQLTIEHAALAAEHEIVVFADAAEDADSPFYFHPVTPSATSAFTSHSVTPGEVLGLARTCFGASPAGFLLGMRAYDVNRFHEGLSPAAREGLESALQYLLLLIEGDHIREMGS
jgi:hydrogenase maturation protease